MPRNGTGAVVISPTRELAIQIYNNVRSTYVELITWILLY